MGGGGGATTCWLADGGAAVGGGEEEEEGGGAEEQYRARLLHAIGCLQHPPLARRLPLRPLHPLLQAAGAQDGHGGGTEDAALGLVTLLVRLPPHETAVVGAVLQCVGRVMASGGEAERDEACGRLARAGLGRALGDVVRAQRLHRPVLQLALRAAQALLAWEGGAGEGGMAGGMMREAGGLLDVATSLLMDADEEEEQGGGPPLGLLEAAAGMAGALLLTCAGAMEAKGWVRRAGVGRAALAALKTACRHYHQATTTAGQQQKQEEGAEGEAVLAKLLARQGCKLLRLLHGGGGEGGGLSKATSEEAAGVLQVLRWLGLDDERVAAEAADTLAGMRGAAAEAGGLLAADEKTWGPILAVMDRWAAGRRAEGGRHEGRGVGGGMSRLTMLPPPHAHLQARSSAGGGGELHVCAGLSSVACAGRVWVGPGRGVRGGAGRAQDLHARQVSEAGQDRL